MSDLALDPLTGDLEIDSSGNSPLTTGVDAIRQRVEMKLRMVKGEWEFNRDKGTDYYGKILGQKNYVLVNAELVKVITSVRGVIRLRTPITFKQDPQTRVLSIQAQVQSESGDFELSTEVTL